MSIVQTMGIQQKQLVTTKSWSCSTQKGMWICRPRAWSHECVLLMVRWFWPPRRQTRMNFRWWWWWSRGCLRCMGAPCRSWQRHVWRHWFTARDMSSLSRQPWSCTSITIWVWSQTNLKPDSCNRVFCYVCFASSCGACASTRTCDRGSTCFKD